jgi:HlyD family secretion protein
MQDNLMIVKQKQENLTIRAPVSGHLTALDAELGEAKSQGQRLGQIDVLEGFKVRAAIDEHYIARVEKGRTGEFDFAGNSYQLIVKTIYPEVRDNRFEVDLEFISQEPQDITRGQTLHIRLELGDISEAILLARGGFYQTTGGNWAYVVDGSGSLATKRRIRLGRQNPQVYEVLEGLEPGERVITSSYENFGNMERLVLK